MNVMVVKAGTERQQGVAYLDDGTMVVVEDGQHYMNEQIEVVVTSALQTAAGRMILPNRRMRVAGLMIARITILKTIKIKQSEDLV